MIRIFQKTETNRDNCPIQLTSKFLGDKWILLIIRELFLGSTRFDEFEKNLSISKSVLSVKLKFLVDSGLVVKTDYQEEMKRRRSEYHLSLLGRELLFIMGAIMEWGNTHMVDREKQFLKIVDPSGAPVRLTFVNQDNQNIALDDLGFQLS